MKYETIQKKLHYTAKDLFQNLVDLEGYLEEFKEPNANHALIEQEIHHLRHGIRAGITTINRLMFALGEIQLSNSIKGPEILEVIDGSTGEIKTKPRYQSESILREQDETLEQWQEVLTDAEAYFKTKAPLPEHIARKRPADVKNYRETPERKAYLDKKFAELMANPNIVYDKQTGNIGYPDEDGRVYTNYTGNPPTVQQKRLAEKWRKKLWKQARKGKARELEIQDDGTVKYRDKDGNLYDQPYTDMDES